MNEEKILKAEIRINHVFARNDIGKINTADDMNITIYAENPDILAMKIKKIAEEFINLGN